MSAPRLEIHLERLHHNARILVERLGRQGIAVTGVNKATLGLPEIVHTWLAAGIERIGESRIESIEALAASGVAVPMLLVRAPMLSQVNRVVAHAAISCNSEPVVLRRQLRQSPVAGRGRRSRSHQPPAPGGGPAAGP